jgi:hypothetical protein
MSAILRATAPPLASINAYDEHWTTCAKCHRPTASTSIFCTHHTAVIAFEPKWWLTGIMLLAPTLTILSLSEWKTPLLIYIVLSSGILLYQVVAFRLLPLTRDAVMIWSLAAFILIGAEELSAGNSLVANIAICLYFVLFGILILRRALKYVEAKCHGMAVAIGAASSLITLYSFSLEFARLLEYCGLSRLWLSRAYTVWWFWIMLARVALITSALVILLIKASTEVSASAPAAPAQNEITPGSLLTHLASQFGAWADFIFALAKAFWQLFTHSIHIVTRLAIRFVLEEVLPAFVILGGAAAALWISIGIFASLTHQPFSALGIPIAGLLIVCAVFVFGYLRLVADFTSADIEEWPPLLHARNPYWYGAITDTRMLAAYISYVIPLTTVLLYCVLLVTLHFGHAIVFPGFGAYFFLSTLVCLCAFAWGYLRNRKRRKPFIPAERRLHR